MIFKLFTLAIFGILVIVGCGGGGSIMEQGVSDQPQTQFDTLTFENPVIYENGLLVSYENGVYVLNLYPLELTQKDEPVPYRMGDLSKEKTTSITNLPLGRDWQLDVYQNAADVGNPDKALTAIYLQQ